MATWNDLVRRTYPDYSDDDCDSVLWNETCFPMGTVLMVARQIKRRKKAHEQGLSMCMACGKPYKHKSGRIWIDEACVACEELWAKRRAEENNEEKIPC